MTKPISKQLHGIIDYSIFPLVMAAPELAGFEEEGKAVLLCRVLSKAIDEVRAQEAKELVSKGHEPVLTKTRWLLLKRPENLTEKQEVRLADLVRYNLRSVRSYLLKEDFQSFWEYTSPGWAQS